MKPNDAVPETVPEVIEKWPSASVFARDIGLKRESHATVMKTRRSIPVPYWGRVLAAATTRNIKGLSFEVLAKIHEAEASRDKQGAA